jgi:hypothetical protein
VCLAFGTSRGKNIVLKIMRPFAYSKRMSIKQTIYDLLLSLLNTVNIYVKLCEMKVGILISKMFTRTRCYCRQGTTASKPLKVRAGCEKPKR